MLNDNNGKFDLHKIFNRYSVVENRVRFRIATVVCGRPAYRVDYKRTGVIDVIAAKHNNNNDIHDDNIDDFDDDDDKSTAAEAIEVQRGVADWRDWRRQRTATTSQRHVYCRGDEQ